MARHSVGFDFPGVKRAVEGPEFDGALLEHAVQVKQVVPAGVVVFVGVVPPIAVVVPKLCQGLHGLGLLGVQPPEKIRVHRAAPLPPALRANLQGHGQQVLFGVDDVDQVAQDLGCVFAEADVDVDAAGGVCLCAGGFEFADQGLHSFDVVPAADGADHLGLVVPVVGDGRILDDFPDTACAVRDLAGVVAAAGVGDTGSKVCCDDRRGVGAGDVPHFEFDAKSLVFHGGGLLSFFGFCPAGFAPAA